MHICVTYVYTHTLIYISQLNHCNLKNLDEKNKFLAKIIF